MKISQRRVQQLLAEFRATGAIPVLQRPGRPRIKLNQDRTDSVLKACEEIPAGVQRITRILRKQGTQIRYDAVYRVMKDGGYVVPSAAKSKRRKWVRYERKYSNAMWHTDWHAMKDPRFRDLNLITYIDDSPRCVTAARVFTEATSMNAVLALRDAIGQFGSPATILSDNGSCFVGRGGRKKGSGAPKSWTPTAFEAELLDRGIELINSRPCHPQTNGKLERFHRTLEEEIVRFGTLSEFVAYYNERRLHWSLDIDNYEVPLKAFHSRKVPEAIRQSNPGWMEADTNDQAK